MTPTGDDGRTIGVGATVAERYRLDAELGRGGMGRVWRAHDARLDRVVALKELLLPPGMEQEEQERLSTRMEREARAAAMGTHPSIVAVHDVLQYDGRPWIVMAYLSGRSLRELVRDDGPCDGARALAWAEQLLDALDGAHRRGVIHRDVKPANVMITDEGRAVLTDFGIAQIGDSSELTATAGVIGSPGYLAPERLRYSPATPASDLFALGATLYYAVVGTGPFQRTTTEETVQAVLNDAPRPPEADRPVPALVEGMLRKDPAARMTTEQARELLGMPGEAPTAPQGPAAGARDADSPTDPVVTAASTLVVPGPPPVPPGPHPSPGQAPAPPMDPARRSREGLAWPLVALVLGVTALLVLGTTVVVLALRDDSSARPVADQAATGPGAQQESGEATGDAAGTPSPAAEDGAEDGAAPQGTRWVSDPDHGFAVLVPEGWQRRVEDPSVYFEAPADGVYLQVDVREHPTDDQLAHVQQSEGETIDSGRLPDYERVRMADVTDTVGGDHRSVADWEFTWRDGDGALRRVLTRNYTTASGRNVTVAWAAPEAQWQEYAAHREACLSSMRW